MLLLTLGGLRLAEQDGDVAAAVARGDVQEALRLGLGRLDRGAGGDPERLAALGQVLGQALLAAGRDEQAEEALPEAAQDVRGTAARAGALAVVDGPGLPVPAPEQAGPRGGDLQRGGRCGRCAAGAAGRGAGRHGAGDAVHGRAPPGGAHAGLRDGAGRRDGRARADDAAADGDRAGGPGLPRAAALRRPRRRGAAAGPRRARGAAIVGARAGGTAGRGGATRVPDRARGARARVDRRPGRAGRRERGRSLRRRALVSRPPPRTDGRTRPRQPRWRCWTAARRARPTTSSARWPSTMRASSTTAMRSSCATARRSFMR